MYPSARFSTIFLFVVVFRVIQSLPSDDPTRADIMQQLYLRIAGLQAKHTRGFLPPLHWATEHGAYKSTVRINTHGKPWISKFRQIGCHDDNAFATLWVTMCLLEVRQYGRGAPELHEEQMNNALELINSHHDKNHPAGTGVVDFWPQILNKSSGMWISQPDNLVPVIDLLDEIVPWEQLVETCERLGPAVKEACTLLNFFRNAKKEVMPAFKIPPDFDDSFLNIGLGSLLKHTRKRYPGDLYKLWASNNTKADVFRLLKTYAYRPLSNSLADVIDPRTYYYIRGFVEKAKNDGKDVALTTTWMQNLTEERVRSPKGVSMPFHLNNVDSTVAANVVYGITAALLENLFDTTTWFDNDVLMIYENTTSLIEWVIESGTMTSRPDLALTYYPSRYNFYWFVSRTRFLLDNRIASGGGLPVNIPSLRFVYERLNTILQTRVTWDLLSEAKTEGEAWVYFDDFLGGGDETWDGKSKVIHLTQI